MVQLWDEFDVAGVGLAFTHVMAAVSPCVRMLDLMRVYTLFCGPGLLAWESALYQPLRLVWVILRSLADGKVWQPRRKRSSCRTLHRLVGTSWTGRSHDVLHGPACRIYQALAPSNRTQVFI